jgi:hypothetical protein
VVEDTAGILLAAVCTGRGFVDMEGSEQEVLDNLVVGKVQLLVEVRDGQPYLGESTRRSKVESSAAVVARSTVRLQFNYRDDK